MVHFPEIKDALSELEEMRLETQIDLSAKDSSAFLTKSSSVTSTPIKETNEESSSTNNSEDDESSSSSSSDGVAFPHQKPEPRNRRLREKPYPPACLFFLRLFPGNDKCLDCGDYNPFFAYVNAGVLLCSSCSSNSEVNSKHNNIKALDSNDEWNLRSVLLTLIGGNENMKSFLDTEIGPMQEITGRYATDAAIRYCCNLERRVEAWMQKPITEDIFKSNSYWLANYQPPNLILAERALSALCEMTMRSGVQSSLNNQSRRSLFQVTGSVASSSRRSSAGSGLRSIAGIFSPDGRRGTNETFGSTTNSSSFSIPTVTDEITLCSRLSFPPACYFFLRLLPKNDKCLECGDSNPQFANIYFGVLICSQCREQHCLIGFRSRIKSLWLDRWTLPDVLFMMEGGNGEFVSYVDNNHIHNSSNTRPATSVTLTGIGRRFSAIARRGSVDATSKEKHSQRWTMDDPHNKKGSVGDLPYDLAERYNCKMAAQYRLLLSQRVAVVASQHGAFVPESYFQ